MKSNFKQFSQQRRFILRSVLQASLLVLLQFGITHCGGGTSGTDNGGGIRVSGQLIGSAGSMLPQGMLAQTVVTDLESGDQAMLDGGGNFSLVLAQDQKAIDLEFVTEDTRISSERIVLDPSEAKEVSLRFMYDPRTLSVTLVSLQIVPRIAPPSPEVPVTPSPTPDPRSPRPEPTTEERSLIRGQIYDLTGKGVPGIVVQIAGTRARVSTGKAGIFRIQQVIPAGELSLILSAGTNSTRVSLGKIPAGAHEIVVTLRLLDSVPSPQDQKDRRLHVVLVGAPRVIARMAENS